MEIVYFNWTDYSVFIMMLVISASIGVYFGCFGSKQNTVKEYLLGGKNMKSIPIAFSLIASTVSGTTLIGVPSEVYTAGPTFLATVFAHFFSCIIGNWLFLPIFLELKITSVYEYLELRFNKSVRRLTSAFFNASYLLFLPTIIYVPSLCLSQVTGINLHIITVGITCVCVFYTMLGGLKAVVWTDCFQTIVTVLACFMIVIIGTKEAGGLTNVLSTAYEDGKLNVFDMDPNPFKRTSFLTVFLGAFFTWSLSIGTGQANVQRFKSLKSPQDTNIVMLMYWIGVSFFTTISVYGGLLIYVTYYGCDPIEQNVVKRADQIFPFYVLDKVGYVPTLPGFFIAGVFSAALSSLSTGLNTIAGTIYEDYIKKTEAEEKRAHIIMKCIVLVVGIFSILFVFLIERMGKILSASFIITSVTSAPVSVLFCLGMLIPWANPKGAIAGALSASLVLGWIAIGSSLSKVNFVSSKIYPVDTCDYTNATMTETFAFNSTINNEFNEPDEVFFLFRLSYMLYKLLGLIVGITVGTIVSLITGRTDPSKINPVLISPPLRRFLPKYEFAEKEMKELMINVDQKIYVNI